MHLDQPPEIAGEMSTLLKPVEDGLVIQDDSGRVLLANATAARMLGFEAHEQMVGLGWTELMRNIQLADEGGKPLGEGDRPELPPSEERQPRMLELRYRLSGTGEERWMGVISTLVPGTGGGPRQVLRVLRDYTAERRSRRALRFLSEASALLASSLNLDTTLQSLGRLVVPELADWCAVDLLEEDGTLRLAMVQHFDPARVPLAYELRRRYPSPRNSPYGPAAVIRSGKPEFFPVTSLERMRVAAVDEEHLRLLLEIGMTGTILVPLIAHGRTLGTLTLVSSESRRRFERDDLSLAMELANRAGIALDNAHLFQKNRETEERLALALEAGRMGYYDSHLGTKRMVVSSRMREIFDLPADCLDLHGYNSEEIFRRMIHPEEQKGVMERIQRLVRDRAEGFQIIHRTNPASGAVRWVESLGKLIFDPDGTPVRMLGIVVDVTERLQGERALKTHASELERSNTELERSNTELKRFAYVAAHDLQEPLRTVASYTQLLARRYQGQLDAEADEFIGFVVEGVRRMKAQLEALLTYSEVGSERPRFVPCALQEILRRVLEGLRPTVERRGAEVSFGSLPEVLGDPLQLGLLLRNLIDNAIKFAAPDVPPRVFISAERRGDEWCLRVRDNGIGIDPQYFERIFELFKRLHGRDEYPGTGIGLAICKKVIERHKGRIWVESTPGQGSTFSFTLPIAAAGTVARD